jgi:hypothetical protein
MTEHNLPDKDDAPWLDCMDGFASAAEHQISEEENKRRFREALRIIRNTTHEELVELMGEEFLEEFRRVSQR